MTNTSKNFVISDIHLSAGAKSLTEDFKLHPMGVPMWDTRYDKVLDPHFVSFIDYILEDSKQNDKLRLIINGDWCDFPTVKLPGVKVSRPYKEVALKKLILIMKGHPSFFDALLKFCKAPNTELIIIYGNHDIEFNWDALKQAIIRRVSPTNPGKVQFLTQYIMGDTLIRHGESEPHTKGNTGSKILKGKWSKREVLDVSMGHYLTEYLMCNLRKHNYLVGRMHKHTYLYINGVKCIGRESWYRDRWFFFRTVYYVGSSAFIFSYQIKFWHIQKKFNLSNFANMIHWTMRGSSPGHTPRDSAIELFKKYKNIKCIMLGHEHKRAYIIIDVDDKERIYINTGAWIPLYRIKAKKPSTPWIKLRWLQKITQPINNFFSSQTIERVLRMTVGVIEIDKNGNTTRQLAEWTKNTKTLKRLL